MSERNTHNQDGRERRQYVRVPFQRNIKYRLCYERVASEILEADANNISQNGILFKTKYPPQVSTIVALNISPDKFKEYLTNENLTDIIAPDELLSRGHSIFGEVVRVIEDKSSGFFSVAVKLVLKKDADSIQASVKEKIFRHPQYINPDQIPEDEQPASDSRPKTHPQYIDPTLAQEDD